MPPVTKGHSGQVNDDRCLSVPQLSATATADGFESYWNGDAIKAETSHCRWLGDGLSFKRREMVTHLAARFIYWSLRPVFLASANFAMF